MGGVGKTSLVRAFMASHRMQAVVRWLDLYDQPPDPVISLETVIQRIIVASAALGPITISTLRDEFASPSYPATELPSYQSCLPRAPRCTVCA
jgi:hypothetical protein